MYLTLTPPLERFLPHYLRSSVFITYWACPFASGVTAVGTTTTGRKEGVEPSSSTYLRPLHRPCPTSSLTLSVNSYLTREPLRSYYRGGEEVCRSRAGSETESFERLSVLVPEYLSTGFRSVIQPV